MTALTAGGPGMFPRGASDLRSSARANLRRGLAASAALHLALLAIILRASGGGEAVVRTYTRTTDFLTLQPFVDTAPPMLPRSALTPQRPPDEGVFDPVPTTPELPKVPFGAPALNPSAIPGEPAGPTGGDVNPGLPAAGPPKDVYEAVEEEPVPIFAPTPAYPPWARDAGVTGRVVLNVLVGKDGRVRQVVIVRDVRGLGDAARDGLLRWVFRPARANGAAVATWVSIPVVFRL